MRAALCTGYGAPEVLQVGEVPTPIPRRGEVRVQVNATAVTASDCITRRFAVPRWSPMGLMMGLALGFRRPRNPILGMVLSGEVDAVGAGVTSFAVGDRVFAFTGTRCGAHAEYACVPVRSPALAVVPTLIAARPRRLTDEEAAAIPFGGLLALCCLERLALTAGQRLLVYGASGSIGSAAVQLARCQGATVTAVCGPSNQALVASLGAAEVVDYTRATGADARGRYELILDAVGKARTSPFKEACRGRLSPGGRYLSIDDFTPRPRVEQLVELGRLAERGDLQPVIDRTFTLEDIVEAHRHVDQGHKRGNVVVTVRPRPADAGAPATGGALPG